MMDRFNIKSKWGWDEELSDNGMYIKYSNVEKLVAENVELKREKYNLTGGLAHAIRIRSEQAAHIERLREAIIEIIIEINECVEVDIGLLKDLLNSTPKQSLEAHNQIVGAEARKGMRDTIMQDLCEQPLYDNEKEDAFNLIYDDLYRVISTTLENAAFNLKEGE